MMVALQRPDTGVLLDLQFFFLTDEDQTDTMLVPRSPRSFSNAESPASGGGGDSPTAAMGGAPSGSS
eukprot:COSAG01_NODE_2128_length_8364_cov_100.246461_4_plen_67_part_00